MLVAVTTRPSALERRAWQVVMGAFAGPTVPAWAAELVDRGLGAVCLFGSNVDSLDQVAGLTGELHGRSPDLLVATDEEGGDVTRLHLRSGSPFPGNAALGVVDDVGLTEQVARAIGRELAAAGVDLDLAPVVDVNSDPRNPVIGVRSFGADPALVARHAAAYVTGLQSRGVGACAKHFPGHGDTSADSHLALPVADVAVDTLLSRELAPFRAAVDAGAVAVMTAHVLVPALDRALPATLSPGALSLLRADLGFDGLLVSDALDMRALSGDSGDRRVPAAAVRAVAAGCDLLCLGADKGPELHRAVVSALVAAVHEGTLAEGRLAEAAARVTHTGREARRRRSVDVPSGPADGPSLGIAAARRAVRVRGELPAVTGAVVLRLCTGTNAAVSDATWGLPLDGAVLGGRPMVDVRETTPYDEVLAATAGRPVVVLVRDAHLHPWAGELLRRLAVATTLVVADMGWPGPDPLPGTAVVSTFGAARASGAALDELLGSAG